MSNRKTNHSVDYPDIIRKEIEALPSGSVCSKNINGKSYYYYRYYEDHRRKEKYIPFEKVDELKEQIQRRKMLEKEYENQKDEIPLSPIQSLDFKTHIRIGNELKSFYKGVLAYRKRSCFSVLKNYLYEKTQDKVFILYGLRRTGKTTLIRQALSEMDDDTLAHTAFIQVTQRNTLSDINHDLRYLEALGYTYVFLDEVTLMEDFIEGAALFSDVFVLSGMRIILSGTDSLGFLFTQDEQLYDRCVLLHTTFIPYREFETVLGIQGIDNFVQYGGTMSLSGKNYNESSPFANVQNTKEYVDSAIAKNIQHSLRYYQYANHFRNLQDLYEQDELTSVINRVVEDINHRFTLEVLTRDFKSNDLGISRNNLRHDSNHPTNILDRINLESVTERLRKLLEIRNRNQQGVPLQEVHASEIKEYLKLLDLIQEIDVVSLPHVNTSGVRTVITQPGLRFCQADALIQSLLEDEEFMNLSLQERNFVSERIRNEIRGRMMEDQILLETKLSNPKKQVFTLHFAIGEFDMVKFSPFNESCEIYEIKHSDKIIESQYRHLNDVEKCNVTEHRYGKITGKYVIYRGESQIANGIQYINVEEYLKSFPY